MPKPSPSSPDLLRDQFGRLCAKYGDDARQYVRLKLGAALRRRLDSDDVQQEVLLEAWRVFEARVELHKLTGSRFKHWLAQVIHNKVLKLHYFHVEAQRRSVHREEPIGTHVERRGERTPSAIATSRENFARLESALLELSPKEQDVIRLVHWDGLKVAEAAAKLKKTPGSTSVLLCEARAKLARLLGIKLERTR